MTIKATATDNVAVSRIELNIDGSLKSASSSNTLTSMWNTVKVSQGDHVISVKACDSAGNAGTNAITIYK